MAATEGQLGILHQIVAKALTDKINSGEYTASDIANALKMLKDNNVTCIAEEGNELGELQKALDNKSPGLDQTDLTAALDAMEWQTQVPN